MSLQISLSGATLFVSIVSASSSSSSSSSSLSSIVGKEGDEDEHFEVINGRMKLKYCIEKVGKWELLLLLIMVLWRRWYFGSFVKMGMGMVEKCRREEVVAMDMGEGFELGERG